MNDEKREIVHDGVAYWVSRAHPAADALPWHTDRSEFSELVADMKANGFDPSRPITRDILTGLIIGGRRRELAAILAGVTPIYRDVSWTDDEVVEYVRREDLVRRNLSASERAAAAVEIAKLLPQGRRTGVTQTPVSGNVAAHDDQDDAGESHADLAAGAKVAERTIRDAAKVKNKAPDLFPAVKEGKLPAHTAAKVADLPPEQRAAVVAAANPKEAAKKAIAAAPAKKAKKKPAKKTPRHRSPLRDSLRDLVPDCVADTFEDPALADAVARINAARDELVSIEKHVTTTLNLKAEFWVYAQFGEAAKSLAAAADRAAEASAQLACGLPYCVCPKCNGEACKDCRQSGYWPAHRYEQRHQYGD